MKITIILVCILVLSTPIFGQQISRYRYGSPPVKRDYSLPYEYYSQQPTFRKYYDNRYDSLNFSKSRPNIYGGQDFYSPYGNRVLRSKPNIYGGYNYYRY